MRCIIFDLDGTLADTALDLVGAANSALMRLGYGPVIDPAKCGSLAMLKGGRGLLAQAYADLAIEVADAEKEKHYQILVEEYSKAPCVHSTLYPGCAAALDRLTAKAARVGLCTNKPGRQVGPTLTGLGIAHHFQAIVAADTLPVRKPDPAPLIEVAHRLDMNVKQSVLIGDSPTDAETARRAGAKLVLVGFGPLGGDVASLDPDAILQHFDELDDVLAQLPA